MWCRSRVGKLANQSEVTMAHRFYVYENWRAKGRTATMHRGDCRFCNEGAGFHQESSDDHGRWHGPFSSIVEALAAPLRNEDAQRKRCWFCCRIARQITQGEPSD